MHAAGTFWRAIAGSILVLVIAGGFAPAPSIAQSGGMATLEVHSRFCPPNYAGSDLFGDCHGNPGIQGIQFGIDGGRSGSGTPNPEGNLTFTDLPPAEYRITSSAPVDKQLVPAVYCSSGDGSTATQAPSLLDSEASATITLSAGDALICDWYTIPTGNFNASHSNLTIHNRFCPMGYAGADIFKDCHDDVGVAFINYTADGTDTVTSMIDVGDVTFTWLTGGIYNVSTDLTLPARMVCSAFDHAGSPFLDVSVQNGGPVSVELNPGMSIVCDWYVFPTDAFYSMKSSIDVVAVRCETFQRVSLASGIVPDGCVFLEGVSVTVYPYLTGPGEFGDSCTTGASGICQVQVRHMVPLNATVDPANWPEGYGLASNPFYVPPQYTEFAQVTALFLPN